MLETYTFRGVLKTGSWGHKKIIAFYRYCKENLQGKNVYLDFSQLTWMDANLSAVLAGLCFQLKNECNIGFIVDEEDFEGETSVFYRNGLLLELSQDAKFNFEDERQSTVPLRKFNPQEVDNFYNYINDELLGHRGTQEVSKENKTILDDSYCELFDNAGTHSEAKNKPIFSCGQFFPTNNELKFTLTDLGVGFFQKVSDYTGGQIKTSAEAVKWALIGNSTKETPGGTGLPTILQYCWQYGGCLHIATDDCYFTFENGKVSYSNLNFPIQGATIHLVFRYL